MGNAIPATLFLLYVSNVPGVPGQAGALLFVYCIAAALAGFSANEANSAEAIGALATLYGAPCIAFKLASLWCMSGYPITAERHAEIVEALKKRDINGS